MTKSVNLLEGNINSTLTKQTLPMTLGLISLMLFHLADSYFVGQLGVKELAALSFSFPITFTFISLSIGLGIGVSAYVAQTLGKQKHAASNSSINDMPHMSAVLLSVSIISFASFVGYLISPYLLAVLGADETMVPIIMDYLSFWYLAAPFYSSIMTINSLQRANGNTKFPAAVMASSSLLNAIFDPIFIFGWNGIPAMGIQGAAIASLLAWIVSASASLWLINRSEHWLKQFPTIEQFKHHSQNILKIGLPAAAANMLTPIATSVLIAIVATYGEAEVAAFGVGSRIESLAILIILALSMTLPPFISQNFGAKQFDRVKEAVRITRKFSMLWQFGIYLILVALSEFIASIFSDSESVHENIKWVLLIMPLGHGAMGVVILSASSLNALSQPKKALIVSVIRLLIISIPFALLGSWLYGFIGLLAGVTAGYFITALIATKLVNRVIKQAEVS
jgi:putative MATE family efflux protein